MNIDQQRVLIAWAELQMEIALAKLPEVQRQIEMGRKRKSVTKQPGYKRLRAFFSHLSSRKRDLFIRDCRAQLGGVRQLREQAKASGEELSAADLADLTIDIKDAEGRPIAGLELDVEKACYGSGSGLPGVETVDGVTYVKCPRCEMRWEAHSIGFQIPPHVKKEPNAGTGSDGPGAADATAR